MDVESPRLLVSSTVPWLWVLDCTKEEQVSKAGTRGSLSTIDCRCGQLLRHLAALSYLQ